jgi:hypothetical protein
MKKTDFTNIQNKINNNDNMHKNSPVSKKMTNKNNKPKKTLLTLEEFIEKFFKENHHNFYILRTEVDIKELIKQLNTLIKRFRESLKIPLKIDPRILELCESGKHSEERTGKYLKKYFTSEKQQFRKLYNRTNRLLNRKNGINTSNLLRISNKNNEKITKYLETTNSKLKRKLISEIRLRKFAIECGFETWEQLKDMFRLFKFIYRKGLNKYFNFNSDINNNESESVSESESDNFLSGLNLHRGAQIRDYKNRIRNVLRYHDPDYNSNNEIYVNNNTKLNNISSHPRIQAIKHYLYNNNNNN